MFVVTHLEDADYDGSIIILDGYTDTLDEAEKWCRSHTHRISEFSDIISGEYTISEVLKKLE